MLSASLFALMLAAAAADEPVATSPAARETAAAAAPQRPADIPASAPTDDYGFVAWCHGALSGHMELRELVKPELDALSPGDDDSAQLAAGKEALELYSRALKSAEKASPVAIHNRALQSSGQGYRIWSAARTAEPRTRMWSYLMWELPPRCETAAKRLEERSSLFAEALRPGAENAASPSLVDSSPALPAEPAGTPGPQATAEGDLRGAQ